METIQQLIKVEKEAREYGFDWPNTEMIFEQIISECEEIKNSIKLEEGVKRIQEEIGDLMHAVYSLCIFMNCDPIETLKITTDKFETRFSILKKLAQEEGYNTLKGQNIDVLMKFWNEAKHKLNNNEI
ncbi:MAG: hypothetical protein J0H68_00910 [Sphingobacteriia bacterium]|nr:hypothetical protein [Sphingobacteriia bacterium]